MVGILRIKINKDAAHENRLLNSLRPPEFKSFGFFVCRFYLGGV